MLKEIGLIGLGVMGKNIALNLSEKGVVIKGFNKSKGDWVIKMDIDTIFHENDFYNLKKFSITIKIIQLYLYENIKYLAQKGIT